MGWFVAELEMFTTDSYHGTLTRKSRTLSFKDCAEKTPKHLQAQTCVDFNRAQDSEGNLDFESDLRLFGAYDGYGGEFSYLKLYFQRCQTSLLREIFATSSASCLSSSQFDKYMDSVSIEVAV